MADFECMRAVSCLIDVWELGPTVKIISGGASSVPRLRPLLYDGPPNQLVSVIGRPERISGLLLRLKTSSSLFLS